MISDEIANLELEITLQMYHERVDRLHERLHKFRQSYDEIAILELEITLQVYHGHVDRLDERVHEFRQSQELP